MNARRPTEQLGWLLPGLALLVVLVGVGAGFGVRQLAADPAGSPAPVTTVSNPRPSGPPPGPGIVQLSQDAQAHPDADAIRSLLQRHFDAINNKDYAAWASTVVARRSSEMPRSMWQSDYGSTRDGSILVHRVEPSQLGPVAMVSFTSTQNADKGPSNLNGSRCTRWWVSYRMVIEGGLLRIDAGVRHSTLNADCTAEL